MDHPTPYSELNQVLGTLVASVHGALGDTFVGAYLQGSFAVGEFDEHSDVDFIVAVRDELTDAQVARLQAVHGRIYDLDSEWAKHLEGSYFPLAELRHAERRGRPLWYLDHGSRSLARSNHCNTILVRCVVRENGVTLAGPSPATLVDAIPTDALRREIHATISDWGREILDHPEPFANRFYQGYLVLNFARMLHDLIVGRPGSKRAGATWAKATFGVAWADLIDRAWGGRPNPAAAVREPADPADVERTLQFVRMVMAESERYVREHASAPDPGR
jgi:aminoglycoside adenylyltransferase-like protein/nucleotidyltransferase-like protein